MHPQGADEANGHHYCQDTGDEYGRCCHCGDERPYRMVLARWCPHAIRPARKVAEDKAFQDFAKELNAHQASKKGVGKVDHGH